MPAPISPLDTFLSERPRLFAIAYRMLGTRQDAEDILQDAWLRWQAAAPDVIVNPQAWLTTAVTRLAIDRLRMAQTVRQHYPGSWLPEPLVEPIDHADPAQLLARADELSLALLWVLERLAPEERAAFLMRRVFESDYADIAQALGKSEAACRQLVLRASLRVQDASPRLPATHAAHQDLLRRFIHAARQQDREAMQGLFTPEVSLVGDGGGKVRSVHRPLQGARRIADLFFVVHRRHPGRLAYRLGWVNGEPGLLRYLDGQLESVIGVHVADQRIAGFYSVRNPDKLAGIPAALQHWLP
jgi:RNA polymerase sigma-70 factor (ECF subfamily)